MKRIGKRLLALLLATTMLVTLLPASALAASSEDLTSSQADSQTETAAETPAAAAFTDVPAGAWFREAVEYVYSHDIFNGTSDDTFSPHGTMTRAMTVTVLGRVAQVDPANYAGTSAFTDVAAGSWYAPYVAWAVAAGITDGVGQGLFAPNEPVTRVQMAAFLWRFFQHIGAQLPEDVTDGLPGDYSSIPAYAREAVAALWRCGIFQGDGDNNFTPSRELTRAEVAMLCMRVDTHLVDTGAKSYPDAAEETPGEETDAADNTGSGGSNGNRPGGSGGNRPGGSDEPDEPSDPSDPSEPGGSPEDLYYEPDATENQTTATAQNVGTNFEITVKSSDSSMSESAVRAAITATDASESGDAATGCIQVSGSGGTYTITGRHIDYASVDEKGNPQWVSGFAPGHTYKIVLEDDRLTFAGQDDTVREYDFTVARQEEMNLELADGMVYIPAGSISDIIVNDQSVDELDVALVRVGENGTETNASEDTKGSFTYEGSQTMKEGDIVAVYEGMNPLERTEDTETDGEDVISYVKITGVNGNTYTFEGAEMDEVLKTPDIFPLPVSYITGGDSTTADDGGTITVPASAFVFSGDLYTQMGLDSSATVDVGDYIAFYSGYLDPAASDAGEKFSAEATQQYAEITGVDFDENDDYTITYTMVTLDDILSSMNTYVESDVDVAATLTPEDIADLENSLESQAVTSGFAQEAAMEIARAALQADSLDQVRDEFGLASLSVTGVGVSSGGGALATSGGSLLTAPGGGGNKVQVEVNYTGIRASVGTTLQHFKGMSGLRVELTIPFTVSIQQSAGWALEIEFHPTFIQELRIGVNASVDTIWDNWAYIIWWIDDFKVTASIDVYTFTDIDIDITVTSSDGQEDTPEKIEKLTNFVNEIKSFLDGGGADEEEVETLEARYAEMLQTDSDWVDLFSKNIYQVKKTLALVVTMWVSFDFVVSANVNVYIGMDFSYELGRRYIFTIMVFGGQATSDTISLVPEQYNLEVYVMGKLGLRAGLRITIGVALISKSVASAELVAEIGPYIELYGYFYYQLHYLEGEGRTSRAAGAMYVEVGLYAEMSANLSAIGGLLSWNPTIFSLTLPLWSAGNRYSIIRLEGAPELLSFNYANCAGLPSRFNTVSMDMKTGETHTGSYGLDQVTIQVTNSAVRYDPARNVLWANGTYPFDNLDPIEEGEVIVTLKEGANGKLAFDTEPLQWTIPFHWDKLQPSYSLFLITGGTPSWIELKGAYGSELEYDMELLEGFAVDSPGRFFYGWVDAYSGNVYSTDTLPDTMPYGGAYITATWTNLDKEYISQNYTITGFAPLDSDPTIAFDYANLGPISTDVFQLTAIDKRTGKRVTLPCVYDPELFQVSTDNPGIKFEEEWVSLRVPDLDAMDPRVNGTVTITWIGGGDTFQREVPYSWNKLQPSYNILLVTGSDPGWIQFSAGYDEVVEYDWDLIDRVTAPQPGRVFDCWVGASADEVYTNETLPERMPYMGLYLNARWRTLDRDYINERYTVTGFAPLESVPDISMKYWDPYLFSTDVFYLTAEDKETGEQVTLLCTYDPELFEVTTSIPEIAFDKGIVGLRPGDTGALELPIADGTVTITWIGDGTNSFQRTLPFHWDNLQPSYSLFLITGVSSPSYIQYNAPYGGEIAYDMELLEQVTADAPGRHFAGWSYNGELVSSEELPATMPYQGASIQAVWETVPVEYTVNHYYAMLPGEQPADGEQAINFQGTWYVLEETTILSAYLGEYINANDSTIEKVGFTTAAGYQDFGWLAYEGTVLNHLYEREMYPLNLTCVDGEGTVIRSLSTMLPYGAEIVPPVPPIPVGYTFSGWGSTPATMPAYSVTYTASLRPNRDTPYRVEHYVQQTNGIYTLQGTATGQGTTDTAVSLYMDDLLLREENIAPSYDAAATISGDGSTVVKVRYARTNLHTATFQEAESGRILGRAYFTDETPSAQLAASFPTVSNEGHSARWYWVDEDGAQQDGVPATTPDDDITFYLAWVVAGNTPYRVEHYLENADGGYPTTANYTENKTGTTGALVEVTRPAEIDTALYGTGTYDTTTTIAADGTTVVRVKYLRTTFTLIFDLNVPEGEAEASFSEGVKSEITLRWGQPFGTNLLDGGDVIRVGYGFAGWTSQDGTTEYTSSSTMPQADLTIYAQWRAGIPYTVRHYRQTADVSWSQWGIGGFELGYKDFNDYGEYVDDVWEPFDGYVSYNDSAYFLYETENLTAPEETTAITPDVKSYDGFTSPTATEVTLKADGTTVVSYYYTRKTYSLTVQADDSYTEDKVTGLTVRYGTDLAGLELMRGYTATALYTSDSQPYNPITAPYQEAVTLTPTWEGVEYTISLDITGHQEFVDAMKDQGVTVADNPNSNMTDFTIQYGQGVILPTGTSMAALQNYGSAGYQDVLNAGDGLDLLYLMGLSVYRNITPRWVQGTGTEDNPCLIYTIGDFTSIGTTAATIAEGDHTGTIYFQLVNNLIADKNTPYMPISIPVDNPIVIDGKGKTIQNYTVSPIKQQGNGIFGSLPDGSTIQNLTIDSASVNVGDPYYHFGGVLVGSADSITMDSVVVKNASITLTGHDLLEVGNDSLYIGGLIGVAHDDSKFTNCTVNGLTVNVTLDEVPEDASEDYLSCVYVGSFIGSGKSSMVAAPYTSLSNTKQVSVSGSSLTTGVADIDDVLVGCDEASDSTQITEDESDIPQEEIASDVTITEEQEPADVVTDPVTEGDASQTPDGGTDEPTEETEADAETPPVFEETGVSAPGTGLPGTTGGLDAAALPVERPRLLRGSRPARL